MTQAIFPLVSIIIPTFNRGHLIGMTLDSVLTQSYGAWECLVVDDGSTDNTEEEVGRYVGRDSRFQYHKRPQKYLAGGNGARNYGLSISKGVYVQWFDSDDIMLPNHLEIKVAALNGDRAAMVVGKSMYPDMTGHMDEYRFQTEDIDFDRYALGSVAWKTVDFMVRKTAVGRVQFNEHLKAGQEYNFLCKLLYQGEKVVFVDSYLTQRREHSESIGAQRRASRDVNFALSFEVYWITYRDFLDMEVPKAKRFWLGKCVHFGLQLEAISWPRQFHESIRAVFKTKGYFYFLAATYSKTLFGHYYRFYQLMKGS